MLSHVSVTSDQVAINGDKCMFTLSPGRFTAVSKYRGKVLIHVRDYVIDALSGKMYATKRGVAKKVDKSNWSYHFSHSTLLCVKVSLV